MLPMVLKLQFVALYYKSITFHVNVQKNTTEKIFCAIGAEDKFCMLKVLDKICHLQLKGLTS